MLQISKLNCIACVKFPCNIYIKFHENLFNENFYEHVLLSLLSIHLSSINTVHTTTVVNFYQHVLLSFGKHFSSKNKYYSHYGCSVNSIYTWKRDKIYS